MPKITKEDLLRKDKIVLKNEKSERIEKIVHHQNVEFGIDSLSKSGDRTHIKTVKFYNGLSGSLTALSDGAPYIIGGAGIDIITGSTGAITITAAGGSGTGDIQGVTAGIGLSGGGTSGTVTLNLDINGISTALDDSSFDDDDVFAIYDTTAGDIKKITFQHMMEYATDPTRNGGIAASTAGKIRLDFNNLLAADINPAEDFIAFSDESIGGDPTRKESIADFMTQIAGTGIAASSGVLSVDLNEVDPADVDVANDSVLIIDANASNATKKESIADFVSGIAGSGLSAGSGQLSVSGVTVAQGGTGATSFADKSVIITQTSGPDQLSAATMSTNGQLLIGGTSGPAVATLTQGTNITITNSDGAITIAAAGVAPGAAGSDTQIQFNDGGSALGGDSGLVYNKTTNTLTSTNISGSLTNLSDGSDFLLGAGATSLTTNSNGSITISSVNNQYNAGDGIVLNGGTLFEADLKTNGGLHFDLTKIAVDDSIVATLSGSIFRGGTVHKGGITGSLLKLTDGTPYLRGGENVKIVSQSNGSIIISFNDTLFTAGTGLILNGSEFRINDSIVATLTGSQFSGNIGVTGSIGSTTTITSPEFSGSLTHLIDGTSYLVAGNNVSIVTQSNGSIRISSAGGGGGGGSGSPAGSNRQVQFNDEFSFGGDSNFTFNKTSNTLSITNVTGSNVKFNKLSGSLTNLEDGTSYLVAGANISITTQSNGSIIITGSAGGDSSIGPAEDGSYTDGLFTDFSTSTPVGTAVDRFNEILKSLAPGPAPDLDDIDFNNSSVSGKLSFGSSNTVSGLTNSNTAAGFSAVDVDGTFGSSTSGNNLRIGLLDGSTAVTGDLNEDVTADSHASGQTNYVANAFGSADQGTLKLEVNGVVVHSVELTGSNPNQHVGSGNPGSGTASTVNSNGSGFTNLSTTGSAKFSDGSELDLFQHRTGRYSIAAADQRNGWNYARVIHSLASGDVNTNYVEWINDNDGNALAGAGDAFDSLSMTGNVNLSGVKYFTAGTAQYRVRVTNAYKNVYSNSNITFTTSNCSVSSQSLPSAGNDENKVLHLTGSATISASTLLNESISARAVVPHPLKSDFTATNQTISNILMYNLSNNSTVLQETFRRENFRIQENSYTNQAAITHSDQAWDGSESLAGSDAGHNTGLMFYNQRLVAPSQGANSSNFAAITNGPGSNVNYSGITSGTKTFYRYFQNNTGGSKTDFSVTINGSGTIVSSGGTLNTTNIKVFFKLPTTDASQSTGFMDLATAFATGQVGDNDGCLNGGFDSSLNATNNATFGEVFVANNEYIVMKIQADASFTGHISQITIAWL